jgi:hypothetical protein
MMASAIVPICARGNRGRARVDGEVETEDELQGDRADHDGAIFTQGRVGRRRRLGSRLRSGSGGAGIDSVR